MGTLERWIDGGRGAVLAALVALVAGLPGLIALPALDRNESAFVQATVQMLESGDVVAIRYQNYWRGGASPGAHWLQAATVQALSSPEARSIWPYRLVSLIGVALAAAATASAGAILFGGRVGFVAGVGLAVSFIVSTAAGVATADGTLLGACAVMLLGLARLYLAGAERREPRRRDRALFWGGLIAGVLITGGLILLLAGLAVAALAVFDRRSSWLRNLGWGWGLIALAALAGPWVVAVTIATDGAYWTVLDPPQPEGPLLWQTWLTPFLLFPLSALLPVAVVYAFRERSLPGVRVALAWLIPGWVVLELAPGKQVFSGLPLYPALAWLCAAGLCSPDVGRIARGLGGLLSLAVGLACAGASIWVARTYGEAGDAMTGLVTALLFAAAGLFAAIAVLKPGSWKVLAATGVLAVLAPGWLFAATLPHLDRLWPTRRILTALSANQLDPRSGLAVGPVAAAGYHEPSLVFALGASTETGDGSVAARAIADGRPAIVEAAEETRFRRTLDGLGAEAEPIGRVIAYDYAGARNISVTVYRATKR